jgi:hypothetical protein
MMPFPVPSVQSWSNIRALRNGTGFYRRYQEEPFLSSILEKLRDGWEEVKNKSSE